MAGLFSSAHLVVVVDDQKRPSSFFDLRSQEFQHRSIFDPTRPIPLHSVVTSTSHNWPPERHQPKQTAGRVVYCNSDDDDALGFRSGNSLGRCCRLSEPKAVVGYRNSTWYWATTTRAVFQTTTPPASHTTATTPNQHGRVVLVESRRVAHLRTAVPVPGDGLRYFSVRCLLPDPATNHPRGNALDILPSRRRGSASRRAVRGQTLPVVVWHHSHINYDNNNDRLQGRRQGQVGSRCQGGGGVVGNGTTTRQVGQLNGREPPCRNVHRDVVAINAFRCGTTYTVVVLHRRSNGARCTPDDSFTEPWLVLHQH
jgi:hypothetical protein